MFITSVVFLNAFHHLDSDFLAYVIFVFGLFTLLHVRKYAKRLKPWAFKVTLPRFSSWICQFLTVRSWPLDPLGLSYIIL